MKTLSPAAISFLTFFIPLVAFLGLLALSNSLRESLRYGWRCLGSYPDLWRIPVLFSLGYVIFNILAYNIVAERMGVQFNPWKDPDPNAPWVSKAFGETFWPSAENMSGVFNYLIATFPLSSFVGLAYLFNIRGIRSELRNAICNRFPQYGFLLAAAIFATAIAALLKPLFFLALHPATGDVNGWKILWTGNTVSTLSFLFEYLLATFLQVYFVLMAFAWVRGLHFNRSDLLHFSLRRLGYVLKWIGLLSIPGFLVLGAAYFFNSPHSFMLLSNFIQFIMIPAFTIFTLLMASVQITLTLHNESLHQAIADHLRFFRAHFWEVLIFAIAGILLFWQLKILLYVVQLIFGIYTKTGMTADVVEAVLRGLLGGWLLAAWVCFYRHWSGEKSKKPF